MPVQPLSTGDALVHWHAMQDALLAEMLAGEVSPKAWRRLARVASDAIEHAIVPGMCEDRTDPGHPFIPFASVIHHPPMPVCAECGQAAGPPHRNAGHQYVSRFGRQS